MPRVSFYLVLLLSTLILFHGNVLECQAQIGPSLTASTSKIAYEKGVLDANLIAEIIATKQDEIKKELMNRTVLNCLECGSFATWNYARQSMEVLLNENDTRVVTKELLRHTTELAVVMGISEYYLRFLAKRSLSASLNVREKRFLLQYFKWMDVESKRALHGAFIDSKQVDQMMELYGGFTIVDGVQVAPEWVKEMKWDDLENTEDYYKILTYYSLLKSDVINKYIANSNSEKFKNKYDRIATQKASFDQSKPNQMGRFLKQISYLKRFNNGSSRFSENKKKFNSGLQAPCEVISPNHILIDLVYDVCRRNEYLQNYGFFQNIGVDETVYRYKNKFAIFHNKVGADYKEVEKELSLLVDLIFGSFKAIKEIYHDVDSVMNVKTIKDKIADLERFRVSNTKIYQSLKSLKIDTVNQAIGLDWNQTLDELIRYSLLPKQNDNDMLYYLRETLKPTLIKMNIATRTDLSDMLKKIEKLEKVLKRKALEELLVKYEKFLVEIETDAPDWMQRVNDLRGSVDKLKYQLSAISKDLNDQTLLSIVVEMDNELLSETEERLKTYVADKKEEFRSVQRFDIQNFIQLVNTINNLDDPTTYDVIGKFIANMGGIFGDSRAVTVFNRFANDFDKYLLVDKENQTIEINVEDVAVDLYTRFGKNQSARITPTFTVGVNNGYFSDSNPLSSEGEFSSISYVSEKLGIKYKLIDWNRRISYGYRKSKDSRTMHLNSPNKTKPILSDMHLMAYGAGILYQIDSFNSNSEGEVSSRPFVGLGGGLGFFNGLDFNLSYAIPSDGSLNDGFFNVGFDIKIAEYLSALGNKIGKK